MIECPKCKGKTKVVQTLHNMRVRKCIECKFQEMTQEIWRAEAIELAKTYVRPGGMQHGKRGPVFYPEDQPKPEPQPVSPPEWNPAWGVHPSDRTAEDDDWDNYVRADGAMTRQAWLMAGKPKYD